MIQNIQYLQLLYGLNIYDLKFLFKEIVWYFFLKNEPQINGFVVEEGLKVRISLMV